ncbi:MAG TPA: 50S ribosomal protein L4 [Candidatus Pacearchaeota archaeon]|nr:50S ribosomal protein L4 [Candidatus Pacearchaeota archaeon]
MKTEIFDIHGKKGKSIELPKAFSEKIREDLVYKALEAGKTQQPYSPSLVAGKQHSASGKIIRRRHVWKSGYGRGASRVPRKVLSRKGSQFNWVAAEISSVRGGRRAHPPKTIKMVNTKKINKKEMMVALKSALAATTSKKEVAKRYERLTEKELGKIPFIVESKITSLKVQEFLSSLKKILGENLFPIAMKNKKVRSGKGKLRGRKYKKSAGALIVTGDKEKIKGSSFDVKNVNGLGISDLAMGGLGRLTIYTEEAIKELDKKFTGGKSQ